MFTAALVIAQKWKQINYLDGWTTREYTIMDYYAVIESTASCHNMKRALWWKGHTRGHILYDSTSMNETTQIHKSKETVLARNQNVITGKQFKYFSYLLIYYLYVCICIRIHGKAHMESRGQLVEVGFLFPTMRIQLKWPELMPSIEASGRAREEELSVKLLLGWWKRYGIRQWWRLKSLENY